MASLTSYSEGTHFNFIGMTARFTIATVLETSPGTYGHGVRGTAE